MELVAVKSSFIDSVGYHDGILRVVFKGGGWADFPATPEQHAGLMAAESKGSYFHKHWKMGRKEPDPPGGPRLNSTEEDACCSRRLQRVLCSGALRDKDSWTCPACGVEWKPRMVETIRHWEPVVHFEVF